MWAESVEQSSRGFCGFCRVFYSNLQQHLSSQSHLTSVQSSSRARPLLERFLQDVLLHHPLNYSDPRPSHDDLPLVPAPPRATPLLLLQSQEDSVDRTNEQGEAANQSRYHGNRQQDDTNNPHLISMETISEGWDSPVQIVMDTPVQVRQWELQNVRSLMDSHVHLDNQLYESHLCSALGAGPGPGGGASRSGFWYAPIETILPAPEHIPDWLRGKSWAQVEQEDEEHVERLVRQFRRGRFTCFFDSESLARYGRRSHKKKRWEDPEPNTGAPLSLAHDDGDSEVPRRRRSFRASRCQVVKVSRSTQTSHMMSHMTSPQPTTEAPPTTKTPSPIVVPGTNPSQEERTPKRCFISPVQLITTHLYVLSGPAPSCVLSSDYKHCRKKRRPQNQLRSKVKYKRSPVWIYDPTTCRPLSPTPSPLISTLSLLSPAPQAHVRQLFRSLSPDLNTAGVKGHKPVALGQGRRGRVSRRGRISQPQATPHLPRRAGLRSGVRGRS
ncbi:DBF4-type zinc finger-containing protein 2 isoform X2 [Gouania willdenowi]|nr:DBF4-type zinc finger-containing protein 2 isoform X2 [Gouania willdenowi]